MQRWKLPPPLSPRLHIRAGLSGSTPSIAEQKVRTVMTGLSHHLRRRHRRNWERSGVSFHHRLHPTAPRLPTHIQGKTRGSGGEMMVQAHSSVHQLAMLLQTRMSALWRT
mmetsp:Transcript_47270/g.111490  ORF Transcript_47270/g.111490 Transcript_47270/m.111490 type:complete len:110 (-) Transcript_47270:776-1105(-)